MTRLPLNAAAHALFDLLMALDAKYADARAARDAAAQNPKPAKPKP